MLTLSREGRWGLINRVGHQAKPFISSLIKRTRDLRKLSPRRDFPFPENHSTGMRLG
jgi:hypothetical protein